MTKPAKNTPRRTIRHRPNDSTFTIALCREFQHLHPVCEASQGESLFLKHALSPRWRFPVWLPNVNAHDPQVPRATASVTNAFSSGPALQRQPHRVLANLASLWSNPTGRKVLTRSTRQAGALFLGNATPGNNINREAPKPVPAFVVLARDCRQTRSPVRVGSRRDRWQVFVRPW